MARVFVAMSGGVDSSVAAALLAEGGHDVTGVTMQLLPSGSDPGQCCDDDALRSARRVCDLIGIPHFTVNMRDLFEREVVGPFVGEYAAGRTPNPCVLCNDRVKFSALLAWAMTQGADALATGHYARIEVDADGTRWLVRGRDNAKDQSYFLYRLVTPALDHVLFPLGERTKDSVRAYASSRDLPTAQRSESQEICFMEPGGHARFVETRADLPAVGGQIVDESGNVLGHHAGIARFTVGQRKGLGIAAPTPLYVVAIEADRARVVVGPASSLERRVVVLEDVVWRGGPHEMAVACQTRYRMAPVAAVARPGSDALEIEFDAPVISVAPGQAAVCYVGDRVVGGGTVASAR